MPINEIEAPSYIRIFYRNGAVNRQHRQQWNFTEVPTLTAGEFVYTTYTDAGHATGWSVHDIVEDIFARAVAVNGNLPPYVIDKVEVWQGVEDAPNVLLGEDGADFSDITGGLATPHASAYWMVALKGSGGQQFRANFFENGNSDPQRFAADSPPTIDDDTLSWLLLRSAVEFATQDGQRLTSALSANTGYNRRLAREYGRSIAP